MVNETVLFRILKDIGDYVMRVIVEDLYSSGLAQLVILIGGTITFVSLRFSLQKYENCQSAIRFEVVYSKRRFA